LPCLTEPSNGKRIRHLDYQRMKTVYHYRKERFFARPPEAVWPYVADSARINEISGSPSYLAEETVDAKGRVHRLASAKVGPLRMKWLETFGEWQENHRAMQNRDFINGPLRHFTASVDLYPDGTGTRLVFTAEIECTAILGRLAKAFGLLEREGDKRVATIERLIGEADAQRLIPGASTKEAAKPAARRRLDTLISELNRDPSSHDLATRLADYLLHAPVVTLRNIRPLAMARFWHAAPADVVELFLAAQRLGIVTMGWDLLCPRCRGAKSRVERLHDLPQESHCSSCNIDYRRDFTRNVELTFRPAPWLRQLPQGELCMLGPASTPHIKLQAEVAAGANKEFKLTLHPGVYRFRTVEAGGEADAEIASDGIIPRVTAQDSEILLAMPGHKQKVSLQNDTGRPLFFVIEDRNWARDALTGEAVIAMRAFRKLCPEQVLRPGDDVEIGRIAIMFTDLQGSTKLYDDLGDATAYRLVRDHFAFLSERVERNGGVIVKTVGDAVMGAFHDPADAVRAALSIQDEVASFNRSRKDAGIVLKLGLHLGSCIAVTVGGVLDYFGSTVNTAARLEHQCRGGEVVVSKAVLADNEAYEALIGRHLIQDSAILRGLSEAVHFVRVIANETPCREPSTSHPQTPE
jgi:class 3 adenylate cyclase